MDSLEQELKDIISQNKTIVYILEKARELCLPNWYVGAGAIAQTVWNYKNGLPLNNGIKDYDLVYFDADLSEEKQDEYIERAKKLFGALAVDIVNEARVHLWYKQQFGKEIQPYTSTESAIDTWPTTATSIGISMDDSGEMKIYAPYGLEDLMNLVVRPNKVLVTEEIYLQKVEKWTKSWNNLKVIPW